VVHDVGFLTIAQNTDSVNYVKLATLQAMMLKKSMPEIPCAIMVDEASATTIEPKYRSYFDHVIIISNDRSRTDTWKLRNEPQVSEVSPFLHTIKLESDLLINRDILHWLPILKTKDIVISHGCKTFTGKTATSRYYTRIFDENLLPDLYTGLMYFNKSEFSKRFFRLAQEIFDNWETYSLELKLGKNTQPTTDVVYSLVAKILGIENCCIPSLDFFKFVHMKQRINNWTFSEWDKSTVLELNDQIRICGMNQYDPIHYHCKSIITDETLEYYEQSIIRK